MFLSNLENLDSKFKETFACLYLSERHNPEAIEVKTFLFDIKKWHTTLLK